MRLASGAGGGSVGGGSMAGGASDACGGSMARGGSGNLASAVTLAGRTGGGGSSGSVASRIGLAGGGGATTGAFGGTGVGAVDQISSADSRADALVGAGLVMLPTPFWFGRFVRNRANHVHASDATTLRCKDGTPQNAPPAACGFTNRICKTFRIVREVRAPRNVAQAAARLPLPRWKSMLTMLQICARVLEGDFA
jgi:hypothetical protein